MAIQLQSRNRFSRHGTPWTDEGFTNRSEPTRLMKQTAQEIRRNPDMEVRYVYDRKDFV